MRPSQAPKPRAREPRRTDSSVEPAASRPALLDALAACPEARSCSEITLGWLERRAGIARGLVLLTDDQAQRLTTAAASGLDPSAAAGLSLDLADGGPVVQAAAGTVPAVLRHSTDPAGTKCGALLGSRVVHMVPLHRAELADGGPGLGLLLLVPHEPSELGPEAVWAARALTDRLALLRYAELRRSPARSRHPGELAEVAAKARGDGLDVILHSVADPIVVTDREGNIVLANPPGERFLRASETAAGLEEAAERRIRANRAVLASFVANVYGGTAPQWRGEIALLEPDSGSTVPFDAVSGDVVAGSGEVTAIVTTLHDRSETIEKERLYEQVKRHSEELHAKVREATSELATQNERLRQQALELEHASAMKSQFLASMSHELRTPLNAILGYTELLLDGVGGEVNAQQRKRLERVESNGRHLLAIINDLLDIARIEAGKMPVNPETFKLGVLVDEVVAEVEPLIDRAALEVTRVLDPDMPQVLSDRQKLKQIVLNLLTNALKFTPRGTVRVHVSFDTAGDRISIAVSDTGVGISAENQSRIFEEFKQVETTYAGSQGGTGLGLAICRRLAGMLRGQLSVVSAPGKGSTFTVTVPRRLA